MGGLTSLSSLESLILAEQLLMGLFQEHPLTRLHLASMSRFQRIPRLLEALASHRQRLAKIWSSA